MLPFGIGLPELIVVLAIVLLFFGKDKLPETFRSFGKAIKGFKEEMTEIEKMTKVETPSEKTDLNQAVKSQSAEDKQN